MFGIDDIVGSGLKIVSQVIDRVFPDPNEAAKAKLEMMKLQQEGAFRELDADLKLALEQAKINQLEAQNPNLFVSGARPALLWLCGFLLFWTYVGAPLLVFFMPDRPVPSIGTAGIFELTLGMLGLSGWRSLDKIKGVAAK